MATLSLEVTRITQSSATIHWEIEEMGDTMVRGGLCNKEPDGSTNDPETITSVAASGGAASGNLIARKANYPGGVLECYGFGRSPGGYYYSAGGYQEVGWDWPVEPEQGTCTGLSLAGSSLAWPGGKRYGIVRWTCSATAGTTFEVSVSGYTKLSGLGYTAREGGFFMNNPGRYAVTVAAYGSKGTLLAQAGETLTIPEFAWSSNVSEDEDIVIYASDWNLLRQDIAEYVNTYNAVHGKGSVSAGDIAEAVRGAEITADGFNSMRDTLATFPYETPPPGRVWRDETDIEAEHFAGLARCFNSLVV